MELAALLLPFVIGLHLFLFTIVVTDFANFIDRIFAFFFRVFGDLNQFLDFRSNLFVLILDGIFEASNLLLDLILDLALHII